MNLLSVKKQHWRCNNNCHQVLQHSMHRYLISLQQFITARLYDLSLAQSPSRFLFCEGDNKNTKYFMIIRACISRLKDITNTICQKPEYEVKNERWFIWKASALCEQKSRLVMMSLHYIYWQIDFNASIKVFWTERLTVLTPNQVLVFYITRQRYFSDECSCSIFMSANKLHLTFFPADYLRNLKNNH